MKFSEEIPGNLNRVTRYDDSGVEINERYYPNSIILCPDEPVRAWDISSPEEISESTTHLFFAFEPEIILIGTGRRIHHPDPIVRVQFNQEGIGIEILDTASACRTFNLILAEGRRVVAGLLAPDISPQ